MRMRFTIIYVESHSQTLRYLYLLIKMLREKNNWLPLMLLERSFAPTNTFFLAGVKMMSLGSIPLLVIAGIPAKIDIY